MCVHEEGLWSTEASFVLHCMHSMPSCVCWRTLQQRHSTQPLPDTCVLVCAVSPVLLCRSYILAYNSHALKDIFNVHTLDLQVRP